MTHFKKTAIFIFTIASLLMHPPVIAQHLNVSVGQQGDSNIIVPKRGLSQAKVVEQFGQPSNKVVNIGQPPISVWYYGNFTVYFESDSVIHSVRKAGR